MIKTIPKKRNGKRQNGCLKRPYKYLGRNERLRAKEKQERYTHWNSEFQQILRRYKKAFLSEQCKETKESNRMEKTRDLFKKIRDTKGTFHAKMSTVKDRDGMDLTETEDIKRIYRIHRRTGQKISS